MLRSGVRLLLATSLCVVVACGGRGGVPAGGQDGNPANPALDASSQFTRQAVDALMTGSDDFTAILKVLDQALALRPTNTNAQLFRGIASHLEYMKQTAFPGGQFHNLYSRAGMVNVGTPGKFWEFELSDALHNQGEVKDSTPAADEVVGYFMNEWRPKMLDLVKVLQAAPSKFDYQVDTSLGGPIFSGLSPVYKRAYRLDYGDIMCLASAAQMAVAWVEFIACYDMDRNLLPNSFDGVDFPERDALEFLGSYHPYFGRLVNPSQLIVVKQRIQSCFADYLKASAHIRTETTAQEKDGIMTLGRNTFRTAAERQQFLTDEMFFRQWGQAFVNDFDKNVQHTIAKAPNGRPIDVQDQVTLNLYRFWRRGLDLREIYLKIVKHPQWAHSDIGVTDVNQITPAMYTADGIISKVGGLAPAAGMLQQEGLRYLLRVDNPPVSTKTIDGSFKDWGPGNSVQIYSRTASGTMPAGHDVGALYAAVDTKFIYLYLDVDLTAYAVSGWYRITLQQGSGFTAKTQWVGYDVVAKVHQAFPTGVTFNHTPRGTAGNGGIEIAIPKTAMTAKWTTVSLDIDMQRGVAPNVVRVEPYRRGAYLKFQ